MIKREDVIVDPKDPRVEGLIGKKVYMGNSFLHIKQTETDINHSTFKGITKGSDCFADNNGYYHTMIAPIPEPTYRPFKSAEEFRPYRDSWFVRIGREGAMNLSHYNDKGAYCNGIFMSWEKAFEVYTREDGTPFGVKE